MFMFALHCRHLIWQTDFVDFSEKIYWFCWEWRSTIDVIMLSMQMLHFLPFPPTNLTIDLTNLNGTMRCILHTYSLSQQQHKRRMKEWALAVKLCPIWCVLQIQAQADTRTNTWTWTCNYYATHFIERTHTTNCGHRFYDLSHIICLGRKKNS